MPEYKNCSNMNLSALEAELLVEQGTIESLKHDAVRESAKFWGAVYNRNRIRAEIEKRQPHSSEVEIL